VPLHFLVYTSKVLSHYSILLPRGLRRGNAAVRVLGLWVRIPQEAWMFVCLLWVLCVLSGRGLCDGLITRPEESYRLWCVVVCDIEIRVWGGPGPLGAVMPNKNHFTTYSSTSLSPRNSRLLTLEFIQTRVLQVTNSETFASDPLPILRNLCLIFRN
jgi:hypothetical protein